MRLGEKRHIYFMSNRVSKRKISGVLVFFLILFLLLGNAIYFLKIVRPVTEQLAKNQAKVVAELATHRAIDKLFAGKSYDEIVTLSRTEEGIITAIESNMTRVNQLKAQAALAITEEIAKEEKMTVAVPLGTLMGYDLLSGIGPRIPMELMPYGNTMVDFESSLSASGINQTLLSITLKVETSVSVILPTGSTSQKIETQIPVVQTVIVGQVPENYVSIDRMGEAFEDDVLNIVG